MIHEPHEYPVDMAEYMFSAKGQLSNATGWPPAPKASIISLLSHAYQASLMQEEGRSISATLCLAEPGAFNDIGKIKEKQRPVIFDRPLEFSANAIRKLAPAVTSWRTAIGLRFHEGGGIRIWGLCDAVNQNWGGHLLDDRGILILPNGLNVRILGPGHISAEFGNNSPFTLRGGRLIRIGSKTARWGDFVAPFRKCVLRAAEQAAGATQAIAGDRASWSEICQGWAAEILSRLFERIVRQIDESGHGGTIVVVSQSAEGAAWQKT